jgi:hypothetical protein
VLVRPPKPWFEFQLPGPAISAQARNRVLLAAWKASVADAAKRAWPAGTPASSHHLEVLISEFSETPPRGDRDNIAKPVLDAMQGVVYINDLQVKKVQVEWCDIMGSYIVRYMSPVVAAALSAGAPFLWVRVSPHAPRKDLVP